MLRQPSLQFKNWQKIVRRIFSETVHEIALEIVPENVLKMSFEIVRLVEDAQRTKAPIHLHYIQLTYSQCFLRRPIEPLRTKAFSFLFIIGPISTL